MLFENDACDCTRFGLDHPPHHAVCCRCIQCLTCGRWIRIARWRDHVARPHETPAEAARIPAMPELEPETPPDSLESALQEVSGVDLLDIDALYRGAVRSCIGQLIDHLEELGGPYRADRTQAWEAVLSILLDPERDEDEKVRWLLELFDERSDDLEAQITGVVLSAEVLFPTPVRRR